MTRSPAHIHEKALKTLAPGCEFITQSESLRAYECDAYSAYQQSPLMVALPSTTAEVQAVMKYCYEAGLPITARGAGTSLVGGAMPQEGGVVLALSRMNKIVEFDPDDRMITVQAGITNLMISQLVKDYGLFYAPDPSSQMACTIGGNIAMNSGGAHCLKYGVTTNNLLALTFVNYQGEILHFHAYDDLDIRGLICGSEGQLGIVTEATVKLETLPAEALPMLIAFSSAEDAGRFVASVFEAGIIAVAMEYMDETMINAIEDFAQAGYPRAAALLIVELEGRSLEISELMQEISQIAREHGAFEIRMAQNAEEAARIWSGRKMAFGVMGKLNDYITLDGCVPISRLADILKDIETLSTDHGLAVTNVFHAGDGNLHPLIMYDAQSDEGLARAEALGAAILARCVEMGGCLTGEHGVGIEKRELMLKQWNTDELDHMMDLKLCFDPKWQLNGQKVFPLDYVRNRQNAL